MNRQERVCKIGQWWTPAGQNTIFQIKEIYGERVFFIDYPGWETIDKLTTKGQQYEVNEIKTN